MPARSAKINPSSPLRLAAAFALLLAALTYVLAARRFPVGSYNDDAANILLARSLAHGHYSFPGDLGSPAEFLPAFPALLVPAVLLIEPHWNLLRAIPLFFAALSLWLTWRLARRFLGVEAATAAVALTAFNPALVAWGGLVMPYLPYLALSLALIDGIEEAGRSRRSFVLLIVGAALAPLLRPQGLVLVLCLAGALWHRHGPRKAALFLFGALLPTAAWAARNHIAAGAGRDYFDYWTTTAVEAANPAVLARRASDLFRYILGDGFFGLRGASAAVQLAAGLLVLVFAGLGARLLKPRKDARALALTTYVSGVLIIHVAWHWTSSRYAVPMVPLLWIPLVAALEPHLRDRRGALLLLVLLAVPLRADVHLARKGLAAGDEYKPRTMAWIRENTPAETRFESTMNYSVALLTGRAAGPQHQVRRGEVWLEQAQRHEIGYMHVALPRPDDEFAPDLPPDYERKFADWLGSRPEASQAYFDSDEGSVIFKLNATDRTRSGASQDFN